MTWDGSWSSQVFYAKNIAGGANTVTATFANAINGFGHRLRPRVLGRGQGRIPLDGQSTAIGTGRGMNSGGVDDDARQRPAVLGGRVVGDGDRRRRRRTRRGRRASATARRIALAATGGLLQRGDDAERQRAGCRIWWRSRRDTGSGDTTLPSVSVTAPANGADRQRHRQRDGRRDAMTSAWPVSSSRSTGSTPGRRTPTAPYALAWDTRTVANGAHTLRARAFDAAGNSQLSAAVDVNVANASSFQNEILLRAAWTCRPR